MGTSDPPDDRLRLFCALRLPEGAVAAIVRWQLKHLEEGEAHARRLVPPANLHVTLAFLGSRPAGELGSIVAALRTAAGSADAVRLRVRGYRETRSVGMLIFDDEGGHATTLAERLHGSLEELGVYRREQRPWLPHVTVLRFRERPRLHPPLPDLGGERGVAPSDAAVYMSRLRPDGARYEVLESVALSD